MRLIDRIFNIFAPYECVNCGQEGSVLCDVCILDACPVVPSRCYRCKKLTKDFAICETCRRASLLKHVWVRTEYQGLAKKLIYLLKFRSTRAAAVTIATLMAECLPVLPTETVVVHVPTATSRRRQRGFDHAKSIASHLSKELNLQHEVLIGRKGQTRQVGAKREVRLRQLEDAYFVKKPLDGKSILLVDDIVTTGATLESAAKVLKAAGAKQINAVVFAQK